MKHRIRKLFSLTLALSMLLSMIPLGISAELVDEFAEYETLEAIPFEFELEPGDLPFEQLKDAVLAVEDIPYCISPALAEERGHVNRLYLQEPDDYTVMFQNRDGSKTIYVFSHPVKGMTMTTIASIQVNSSIVSFTGRNAITSCIAELHDYNIGYSEIAYIPNGILSSDGINLTEDARGWTRGESTVATLSYNISGEAAAEYAASIAVPDADVSLAAVAPGITIIPNDPAPFGGMTVMSISYSNLAGLMSFKNAATNQYLTMRPSPSYSLLTSARIIVPLSRWKVSYDSGYGYTVTNLYQPANNYLGFDDNNNVTISSLDNAEITFTVEIVSTNDSKVIISCGNKAIDSSLSVYSNDPSAAYFPTSCEWFIDTKTDCDLVEEIIPIPRTINAGDIFYGEYTTRPTIPTYSDIELYFASNDQPLPNDSDYDLTDSKAYYISETGTYTVYYKDNCTGVRSANFTLQIVEYVTRIKVPSSVRIEQKGVGFTLDYEYEPDDATPVSVSLYYADTDTEVGKNSAGKYVINTAGVYTVYYKDIVSGVMSDDFSILVYEQESFDNNFTYMIQPINALDQFLTMTVTSDSESNNLSLSSISYSKQSSVVANYAEKWNNKSKTFTIRVDESNSAYYNISATLAMSQYNNTDAVDASEYTGTYERVDLDTPGITNSISYGILNGNELFTKSKSDPTSEMRVLKVNDSYIIICGVNGNSEYMALKYVYNAAEEKYEVEAAVLNATLEGFRWEITHVGVDIPCIRQTRDYVCGYTTLLQIIMGAGLDIEVDPTFLADPGDTENDLDAKMKTVWKITKEMDGRADQLYINDYLPTLLQSESVTSTNSIDPIICQKSSSVSSTTDKDLYDILIGSMRTGLAPWIFTRKEYSPYTASNSGAHFIAIAGVYYSDDNNSNNDFVIISNCHYHNNVFGIYVIPYSAFKDACKYVNGVQQYLYYCEPINNGGE